MANLLAQTAASGEWYDGWQLVASAIGAAVAVVIAVVGWLHRQSKADNRELKSDLKDKLGDFKEDFQRIETAMNDGFARTERRIDDLYTMLAQKGMQSPARESQTPATPDVSPSAPASAVSSSEAEPATPVAAQQVSVNPAVPASAQSQAAGFTPATAQSEER